VDNKRLLIAAVLSMAVLFGWQLIFPPPEPVRPASSAPPPAAAPAESATDPASRTPEASTPGADPQVAPAPADAAAPPAVAAPPIGASAEESVRLENEHLAAEFSNRGGVLKSLSVQPNGKLERLELVAPRGATPWPFSLFDDAGAELPLNQALFAVERTTTADGERLDFRYRDAAGEAEKSFLLRADGRIDFEIRVPGRERFATRLGPGLRARDAEQLANRFDLRKAIWSTAGEKETHDPAKAREPIEIPGTGLDWAGLEDTYFLTAVIPREPFARLYLRPVFLETAEGVSGFDARPVPPPPAELSAAEKKLPRELVLDIEARNGALSGTSFWGAKQFDRLASFGFGLERSVELGMFGILARPLLAALQWIHAHWVANYGWAIVILTAALKLLLLPLSLSAFKSMRKMQAINPKMQAIRERWKGKLRDKNGRFNADAQRQMNEEIMGLYRSEGVNPAGGCFPLLVQLPIFFAFYSLLSTAVELWRSPWIGWIHDLTVADPYYVLPIVMGVSQVIQQRMTPPPPDPVQRKLMQFLPIVFTVFSLGFPSGLVIYWLTNNVLSIGQQMLYNKIQDRTHPVVAEVPEKRGKKAK
jgi:YidC/Oxa1 family membrane protein insertase